MAEGRREHRVCEDNIHNNVKQRCNCQFFTVHGGSVQDRGSGHLFVVAGRDVGSFFWHQHVLNGYLKKQKWQKKEAGGLTSLTFLPFPNPQHPVFDNCYPVPCTTTTQGLLTSSLLLYTLTYYSRSWCMEGAGYGVGEKGDVRVRCPGSILHCLHWQYPGLMSCSPIHCSATDIKFPKVIRQEVGQ